MILLSLAEVVSMSGLSENTLRRHMNAPEHPLPCYRVGRRVLFDQAEFYEWLHEHRRASSELTQRVLKALGR